MSETIIEVKNLVKEYRLGAIGGTTLTKEIQSFIAKIRKKEDPNTLVGKTKKGNDGEIFRALDDISFTVKKGLFLLFCTKVWLA